MRIQHNIMAMNAYRNYNNNTSALSKNLEKLSSGYKINRAGDDAAGLAISEKMRAQITGLSAATKNVKDGISLVKTAEGAMQEIQDMLNRMDYLATQSANGTYDNEVDRLNLQKEVNQLKSEINRIADSANFNGIKLLDGSQASKTSMNNMEMVHLLDADPSNSAAQKGIYTIDLSNFKAANSSVGSAPGTGTSISIKVGTVTVASAKGTSLGSVVTADNFKTISEVSIGGVSFTVSMDGSKLTLTMKNNPTTDFKGNMDVVVAGAGEGAMSDTDKGNGAQQLSVTVEQQAVPAGKRVYAEGRFTLDAAKIVDGYQVKIGRETYTFAVGANSKCKNATNVVDLTDKKAGSTGIQIYAGQRLSQAAVNNTMFKVGSANDSGVIHLTEKEGAGIDYTKYDLVGTSTGTGGYTENLAANWKDLVQDGRADTSSGLTLQIGDTADNYNQLNVIVGDMHINALGIGGVNIADQTSAQSAIQSIKDAINYVSGIRGDLGATQNRLEHTQNNLSVMAENIQDAESTIRDTDVAEEMMSYVKNNILVQSAQAMLAQANQVPQGVLQLLG